MEGFIGKKNNTYRNPIDNKAEKSAAPSPPIQAVDTIASTRSSDDIDSDLKTTLRRKSEEVISSAEVYRKIYPLIV